MAPMPNTAKSDQKKRKTALIRDSGSEGDAPPVQDPKSKGKNKKRKAKDQLKAPARAPVQRLRTLEVDLMIRHEAWMQLRQKGFDKFFKENPETAETKFLALSMVTEYMAQHFMFRLNAALSCASIWLNDLVAAVHLNNRCILIGQDAPGDLLLARAEHERQLISSAKKAEEAEALEPDTNASGSYTLVVFSNSLTLTNLRLMRKELKLNWLTSKFLESIVIIGRYHTKYMPSARIAGEFAEELSHWGWAVKRLVFQNVFAVPEFYTKLPVPFCAKLEFQSFKDVAQRGFGGLRAEDVAPEGFEQFYRSKAPALTEIQLLKSTIPTALMSRVLGSSATALVVSFPSQGRLGIEASLDLGGALKTTTFVFDMCYLCHVMPARWSKLQSVLVDASRKSNELLEWIFQFFNSPCVDGIKRIVLLNCEEQYFAACCAAKERGLASSRLRGPQRRFIKQVELIFDQASKNN